MANNPTIEYIEIIGLSQLFYSHIYCNQDILILASVPIKVSNQPCLKLKKETLSFASRQRKLEKLSKQISQVQKDRGHRYCLYVEFKNKSNTEKQRVAVACRQGMETGGC